MGLGVQGTWMKPCGQCASRLIIDVVLHSTHLTTSSRSRYSFLQTPPIPPRYKLQAPRPQHVRVARPRTRPPFVCAPPHPAAFFGTEPNVRCTAIPTYRVPSLRLFWPILIGKICRIGRYETRESNNDGRVDVCLTGHPLTAGGSQPVNYPTALVIFRSSPSLMALARPAG